MMNGQQLRKFSEALISAYPSAGELERALHITMDISLFQIVTQNQPLDGIVFELIRWAESRSRADELAAKLQGYTPTNDLLKNYCQVYAATICKDNSSPPPPPPPPPPPSKLDLINALKQCEVMQMQDSRQTLVRSLSDCGLNVEWSNSTPVLAFNIITACLSTKPHKLAELLEYMTFLQNETSAFAIFRKLARAV